MDAQLTSIDERYRAIPYPEWVPVSESTEARRVAYRQAREEYRKIQHEIQEEFKIKCLELNGLAGHPKADKVWDMAYEDGHSAGLYEVDMHVSRLAELVF